MTTYTVNRDGFNRIHHYIWTETGLPTSTKALESWAETAEDAAHAAFESQMFVDVEIPARWTNSGNPVYMRLYRADFDERAVE